MRTGVTIVALSFVPVLWAQSAVPELGKASDAGQRLFDRHLDHPVAGPDSSVKEVHEVDHPPAYPGGEAALFSDLLRAEECAWPSHTDDCHADTKLHLAFIVERDGRVSSPTVERGGCIALRNRAKCAVRGLARFGPGTHQGVAVRTRMRIPIQYETR